MTPAFVNYEEKQVGKKGKLRDWGTKKSPRACGLNEHTKQTIALFRVLLEQLGVRIVSLKMNRWFHQCTGGADYVIRVILVI